jgi:hypothetical protein
MKKYIILIFAAFLSNCVTPPSISPSNSMKSSLIVFEMEYNASMISPNFFADEIYLIKLDAKKSLIQPSILKTNYTARKRVYLLNIDPGSYAIVGFHYLEPGAAETQLSWYVTLDENSVKKTIFDIKPGEIKYFGRIKLMNPHNGFLSPGPSDVDTIQAHYLEVLSPGLLASSYGFTKAGIAKIENIDNKQETLERLKADVRSDVGDTEWSSLVK